MATGYDNRAGGRQSFAFQAAQPVQGRGTLSGESATVGIRGGETRSGVVTAGPQTDVQSGSGSNIPAFLEQLAAPLIEQRQQEKFFEGVAAVQQGAAIAEIEQERPSWSRMFGPSYYEQGASMYTAQQKVLEAEQGLMSRMDELKRMTSQEIGAELANIQRGLSTGSRPTDNLINKEFLERSNAFMGLVARERVKWQQEEVTRAQTTAILTGAKTFQDLASAFALSQDQGTEATEGFSLATQSFLNLMQPPAGQTEESYKAMMGQVGQSLLTDGNFYAFEALRSRGVFDMLPEATARRLDERYETVGKRKLADAAASLGPERFALIERQVKGEVSAMEVAGKMTEWNDRLSRLTGVTLDFYTVDAITGEVKSVVTEARRQAERREDKADDERRHQQNLQAEEDREARKAAQAKELFAAGQMGVATTAGLAASADMEAAAIMAFRQGDYGALARNAVADPRAGVSDGVKNEIAGMVTANVPAGFDAQSFQNVYNVWKNFNGVPGGVGARAAYFGDNDTKFLQMDNLIRGGTEGVLAFAQTFGSVRVPPARMNRDEKARVTTAVKQFMPNVLERWFGGARSLNDSAVETVSNIIAQDYRDVQAAQPGISEADAMHQSISRKLASGELEIVGGFAWANPSHETRTLSQLTGLTDRELGNVFTSAVDDGFKAQGFNPDGRYSVSRTTNADGQSLFVVLGYKDGEYRTVTVNPNDLVVRNRQQVAGRTDNNRQRQYQAWITERGISSQERFRRVSARDAFLRGEYNFGDNAPGIGR